MLYGYSDHNPVTFQLGMGNNTYLVMSWNIDQSNGKPLPADYILSLAEKPDLIFTQEDRCGMRQYDAEKRDSEDFGNMLESLYDRIYSNAHVACVSNGGYQLRS